MAFGNKTVLITGASSGIGQATAFKFAAGNYLIITYRQNQAQCQNTADKCRQLGAKDVLILPLDLASDESIEAAIEKAINKFGKIDILINNAGFLVSKNLTEQSFEEISFQVKTNLEGLIKITKLCLPYIKQAIINVGSNLGLIGKRNLSVYCAAKFGVRGFAKSLAKEMPNLLIYTINPPLTATRMGSLAGIAPEKVAEIIFNAANGKYRAKSGADINVGDYIYGEFLGKLISFLRLIKGILKT